MKGETKAELYRDYSSLNNAELDNAQRIQRIYFVTEHPNFQILLQKFRKYAQATVM